MLSEGSSVKGSPEDKQPSDPSIRGSAKISRWVTLALYTRSPASDICEQTCSLENLIGAGTWQLDTEAHMVGEFLI